MVDSRKPFIRLSVVTLVDISARPQYVLLDMSIPSHLSPLLIACLASFTITPAACTTSHPSNTPDAPGTVQVSPDPVPATPQSTEPAPEDPVAAPAGDAGTGAHDDSDGGKHFPCASFDPVKSQDSCKAAADCAPSALCHATSCVAMSKAPVRPDGGVMCTMNLVCKSIDVGRCDCLDGVCALVPRQ